MIFLINSVAIVSISTVCSLLFDEIEDRKKLFSQLFIFHEQVAELQSIIAIIAELTRLKLLWRFLFSLLY